MPSTIAPTISDTSPSLGCPALAPIQIIDVTTYFRFLRCVDPKGFREAIYRPAYNAEPATGAAHLAIGNGQRIMKRTKKNFTRRTKRDVISQFHEFAKDPWAKFGKAFGDAYWAFGIEYRQEWKRLNAWRGRLIGAIPLGLYPATKEITVKSWSKTTTRRATSDSVDEARTLDIGGSEKWSIAAKKQMLRETGSSFNPSATVNSVTIPGGDVPVTLGGDLGVSGTNTSLSEPRSTVALSSFKRPLSSLSRRSRQPALQR